MAQILLLAFDRAQPGADVQRVRSLPERADARVAAKQLQGPQAVGMSGQVGVVEVRRPIQGLPVRPFEFEVAQPQRDRDPFRADRLARGVRFGAANVRQIEKKLRGVIGELLVEFGELEKLELTLEALLCAKDYLSRARAP